MLGVLIQQERMKQKISQEALCYGICSTSYLSKIENGVTNCSEEIYEKLFKKLKIDYVVDEVTISALDKEFESVLFALRFKGYCCFEVMGSPISPLCQKMRYSKRCIEASLLCAMRELFAGGELNLMHEDVLPLLTETERVFYSLLKAIFYTKRHCVDDAILIMQSIENVQEAWTVQAIGFYYFRTGQYSRATEKLQIAYKGFADKGYIHGMLDTARLLSAVGSNNFDIEAMLTWGQVAQCINLVVQNPKIEHSLAYNFGATYLMIGQHDKGIAYLKKCEEISKQQTEIEPQTLNMMYQKLSFAFAVKGNAEKAKYYLDKIHTTLLKGHLQIFTDLIRYMIECECKEYRSSSEYCEFLERCYSTAKKENSVGFAQFYVYYLCESYMAQRRYKSALTLLKQNTFLKNTDFFH